MSVSEPARYVAKISKYAWDQDADAVSVYLSDLAGVETLAADKLQVRRLEQASGCEHFFPLLLPGCVGGNMGFCHGEKMTTN